MLKEYKKKTNIFVGLGLVLQFSSLFLRQDGDVMSALGSLVSLGGIILFTIGCWHYAKGKGYHGAYGLLGLLFSILGLIILIAMPDKNKEQK
ncbi:MAG: hypothetical protein U5L10_01075 [Candidatus Moranbacteria bacterium]|nr:hypothetical protein [Candidatus Moranbacteria bacterium]